MLEHLQAAWTELIGPSGGFAMTENEVRGVPMRTYASAPPSMRSVWELAGLHGDKTYLVYEDERYSYGEVAAQVRTLAHVLRDKYGVREGDRVAIAMRNYPEWVVSYWATVCVGAAAVGMNAWWTTPEMEFGLADSRPKLLIADDERVERVVPVLDGLRAVEPLPVISVRYDGDLPDDAVRWEEVVAAEAPAALPDATIDPDDDATIFYTSGTTGFPKGAQITHRGSVHNILDMVFWQLVVTTADAKAVAAGDIEPPAVPADAVPPPLVIMAPTPLFHVTACNCMLHPATLAGGTVVLMRRWDAGRALELIERERVTNFSGVPSMGRELLIHPDWATRDTSSLKALAGGGAPVPPDMVAKIDKSLDKGGVPTIGYGLTETSGIISANSAKYYLAKPLSCGPVVPVLDAKLVDELGNDLPAGPDTVGQLCVRGPIVVKGYLNRPEATADAIRDGWFNTGDIARIDDDGFLFIVDRAKDMVLRGGENVYCAEVEAAIYDLDGVQEAIVFGVPDERLGEAVAAVVVPAPGASLTVEGLQAALEGRIAKHKIPSALWIRDEPLPRNATGKFLKREVRGEILDAL